MIDHPLVAFLLFTDVPETARKHLIKMDGPFIFAAAELAVSHMFTHVRILRIDDLVRPYVPPNVLLSQEDEAQEGRAVV